MMWYVMQTAAGREQELVHAIWHVMTGERQKYDQCFVIYQEYAIRRNGKLEYHVEPLFPSYIFVETNMPEKFVEELRRIPTMSCLLDVDGYFWGIYKEEELFLRRMLEESQREQTEESSGSETKPSVRKESSEIFAKKEDSCKKKRNRQNSEYLIRPSLVWVNEERQIWKAEGILGSYMDRIVKQRLRKRSVVIEIPLCGKMRRVRLGIRLEGDEIERNKILYNDLKVGRERNES